jgi:hypothetical protein
LAAAAGTDGSVATASIFTKALSHTQPQGGSLSTPSISDFLRVASFQFRGFDFTGATFESWLASIDRVKFSGNTYAVRFGPFPFVMNEDKFAKYKGAFKIYGAVTHYIFYAVFGG